MSDVDPEVTIANSLEQPKIGKNDGQEYEQHKLSEKTAAADWLNNQSVGSGTTKRNKGILFSRMIPPGTQN